MEPQLQVVFDAHDPKRLGTFWAEVLGYVERRRPSDDARWSALAISAGAPAAPASSLQKVLERKTVKNRVHLDVEVGTDNHEGQRAGPRRAQWHLRPASTRSRRRPTGS